MRNNNFYHLQRRAYPKLILTNLLLHILKYVSCYLYTCMKHRTMCCWMSLSVMLHTTGMPGKALPPAPGSFLSGPSGNKETHPLRHNQGGIVVRHSMQLVAGSGKPIFAQPFDICVFPKS